MKYFKRLEGKQIYLSPIHLEDAVLYTKWLNSMEVIEGLGIHPGAMSLQQEQKALEGMVNDPYSFAIVEQASDQLLGNIGLNEVSLVNRTATIGLFIGETGKRSQGHGCEAIRLLLRFGFDELNLHNINLHVHADNPRAIACYEKAGLRRYALRKEASCKKGLYVDIISMEILEDDYRQASAAHQL